MVCDEELAIRVLQGWRQQHGGGLQGGRQEGLLLANLRGWQQQPEGRQAQSQQGHVMGGWDDEGPSSSSTATRAAAEEDDEVLANRLGHFR